MTRYSVKIYSPKPQPPYPMARLFVVTDATGAHCVEHKRMTSRLLVLLPKGYVFHGEQTADDWVARLPSEGGGYCYRAAVKEVE